MKKNEILKDHISPIRTGTVWKKDSSGFYYNKYKEKGIETEDDYSVLFHRLGTSESSDVGIFGKGLPLDKLCGVYTSGDKKYMFIPVSSGHSKRDIYYKDLETDSEVKPLVVGKDYLFTPDSVGDQVFMLTNYKADRFRVVTFDIKNPDEENWKDVIPEGKDVLESLSLVKDYLVLNYTSNVSSVIKLADRQGKIIKTLDFPNVGSIYGPTNEFGKAEMFFEFSSFGVPYTIYRCEVPNCRLEKIYQLKVDVKTDNIKSRQIWYKSKDGTRVPMFISYREDIKLDGNNPTLLNGYGGFGLIDSPAFDYRFACFMQRGGIVAIPAIRGGGALGETWHISGKSEKKQNSFNDFISAAEWLIKNDYTNSNKLAMMGASNGGLLVGACMAQRPDLYKVAVCGVGLFDMLRYDKFGLGKFWTDEYGNPEDPKEFKYIIKYSPYHNVKSGVNYPAVMFTTSDTDNRVDPLHSMKMAALMQSLGCQNPILLRTESKGGHGFGRSTEQIINENTDKFTFIYYQLGMLKQ